MNCEKSKKLTAYSEEYIPQNINSIIKPLYVSLEEDNIIRLVFEDESELKIKKDEYYKLYYEKNNDINKNNDFLNTFDYTYEKEKEIIDTIILSINDILDESLITIIREK
jgi:hypothetical protein